MTSWHIDAGPGHTLTVKSPRVSGSGRPARPTWLAECECGWRAETRYRAAIQARVRSHYPAWRGFVGTALAHVLHR